MALHYLKEIQNSKLFKPQKIINGAYSTYYTFSAIFNGKKYGISWKEFRKRYISFGGDGIYGASKLLYQEPSFRKNTIGRCFKSCHKKCVTKCKGTPVAKYLQKNIMNFTTNQSSIHEVKKQAKVLRKTIKYFENKS